MFVKINPETKGFLLDGIDGEILSMQVKLRNEHHPEIRERVQHDLALLRAERVSMVSQLTAWSGTEECFAKLLKDVAEDAFEASMVPGQGGNQAFADVRDSMAMELMS